MDESRIEEWWPRLSASTQAWLIANNGDAIPPEVVAEITAAGGAADLSGAYLSDAAVDWIEAAANDEA
jgi:hypothetical protein